jgi:hypothetical protein
MSEAKPRLAIHIADDKSSVAIEFLPASGASGSLALTLDQVTALIRGLGGAREQMVSGKPIPSLEGVEVKAIFNTRWYFQPEPLSEGSALAFYHPAFGPVGFVVPREQVSEMVNLLTAHLGIRPSPGGKPN